MLQVGKTGIEEEEGIYIYKVLKRAAGFNGIWYSFR
jgi:hypothetical protein